MTDLSALEPTDYIFISYSTKDQEKADAFRRLLKKENIQTWMAPYDIAPGKKYAAVIENAIKNSTGFALLLSAAAQESEWVESEVDRARSHKRVIFPIALEDIQLTDSFSFYLGNRQIIAVHDIVQKAPEVQTLLEEIRKLLPKTTDPRSNINQNMVMVTALFSSMQSFVDPLYTQIEEMMKPNLTQSDAEQIIDQMQTIKKATETAHLDGTGLITLPSVYTGQADYLEAYKSAKDILRYFDYQNYAETEPECYILCLLLLGISSLMAGRSDEAWEYIKRANDICTERDDIEPFIQAWIEALLAAEYAALGDYEKAEEQVNAAAERLQSLEEDEEIRRITEGLVFLARLYSVILPKRFDELDGLINRNEDLLERAEWRRLVWEFFPALSSVLNEDYAQAEQYGLIALRKQRAIAEENPAAGLGNFVSLCCLLAGIMMQQDRGNEAENYFHEAYRALRQLKQLNLSGALAVFHPFYTTYINYLLAAEREKETEALFLEALDYCNENVPLMDHSLQEQKIHFLQGLAELYLRDEQFEKAEKAMTERLTLLRKRAEKEPERYALETAAACVKQTDILLSMKRYDDAESPAMEALAISENIKGTDTPETRIIRGAVQLRLAAIECHRQHNTTAAAYLTGALNFVRELFKTSALQEEEMIRAYGKAARLYTEMGMTGEAERIQTEMEELRRRVSVDASAPQT